MKRPNLLLAAGLSVTSALAGQSPPPPPPPVRTPISARVEPRSAAAAQPPVARLAGKVYFGEGDEPRAGAFTFTLFGEGLRGERNLWGSSVNLDVKGGTGRFEWSIVSPGYDPARGVVTLHGGETATIGPARLVHGSAALEGLVSAPDGRPFAGAEVSLSGAVRPARPAVAGEGGRTKTDEAGRFRFEAVAAGKGFVQVTASDLPAMAAIAVEIAPGGRHWVGLSSPAGSLLVRIHGKWERPFQLFLEDPGRRLATSWKFDPPGWTEDSWSVGCGAASL